MKNDHPVSLKEHDVPPDLAETVETAFGLDDSPGTLDDLVTVMTRFIDKSNRTVGVDDLCTASESRHVARFDGTSRYFHCVLDTLLLPFLRPEATPVEVRSRIPQVDSDHDADTVELTVSREDVLVRPPTTVMSVGLAGGLGPSRFDRPRPDDRVHGPLPVRQCLPVQAEVRTVGRGDDRGDDNVGFVPHRVGDRQGTRQGVCPGSTGGRRSVAGR